jgi:cyclopropane-fatty-acyl-phospholipid synthase
MKYNSGFILKELENIGIHYARTLRDWRNRFIENKEAVMRLGFDEKFIKIWQYYLCYCEAGFKNRILDVSHLVLTRTK